MTMLPLRATSYSLTAGATLNTSGEVIRAASSRGDRQPQSWKNQTLDIETLVVAQDATHGVAVSPTCESRNSDVAPIAEGA